MGYDCVQGGGYEEGGSHQTNPSANDNPNSKEALGISQADVAEKFNVSRGMVKRATKVRRQAEERPVVQRVVEAIEAGRITVGDASVVD